MHPPRLAPSNPRLARPHREGYLFRTGGLGAGYYRKDVVRRHCASAGASAPPPPATPPLREQPQPPPEQQGQVEAAGGSEEQLSGDAARRYIQRLLAAPPSMHCVAANAGGTLLFTASLGPSDSSARVWRLQHGEGGGVQSELHRTLAGHAAPVLSLALSPDGSRLFTGSHDATVRVWSTADWHCLRVLKGHGGGVRAMALAPDGATLYTAASDNTIRVGGWMGGGACGECKCRLRLQTASQLIRGGRLPSAGLVHAALGVLAHDARATRRHVLASLPGAVV